MIKRSITKSGYKLTIPEFPNVELYLTNETSTQDSQEGSTEFNIKSKTWGVEVVHPTKGILTIGTPFATTMVEVLETFTNDINEKHSKTENGKKMLKEIGIDFIQPTTQSSTSVEEGIKIPAYTIDINLTNANGTKRLASTSGGIIKLNPVKSVQEFFNYFEGNEVGPSSAQKKMVLVEMEKQGYPLKKIKSILNTTKLVNTFLVLHEQDHIDQNDVDVYWKMSKSDLLTPDKLLIETRASINALKKIESTQPSTSVKEGVEDNKDISQEPENPFCGPNQ
jgi:nitrate reductase NapAB chaperone NapD